MKTYENFLKESTKYDMDYRTHAERVVTDILEKKIVDEFEKIKHLYSEHIPIMNPLDPFGEEDWNDQTKYECYEHLPKVIKDILDQFYPQWNWRTESIEVVKNNALHFVHYYILDDGEISFDGEKLIRVQYVPVGYEDNITRIGGSLFVLEKLGVVIPCLIQHTFSKNNKAQSEILKETNSFTEAMKEFDKIRKDMNIKDEHCRVDMCYVPGKFTIYVIPKVEI